MATYYKYQNPSEIGAAPTLDWGTVANNINETLQKQEQQRYENREQDKQITNNILTKVNEVNLTSDPNANALITNMTYEAKNNIFELNKKLKAGEISRSDFNILTQNTSSSIAQLNKFSTEYSKDYDLYLKDVSEGKTSAYADFMQKWKGGFQKFKYKKLVHSPTDGRLYVAELDEQGKIKEGPLGLVPMSVLVEAKNFNDKKIDVLAETNRYATQLKPFVDLVRSGKIETVEALSNMPDFNSFVNNVAEAIAKNEKGYASILTDTDGTYTISGEGSSYGNKIGLKNNGAGEMIPDITKEMKAKAVGIIKNYLIAQTGIKETGTEVFAPQAPRGGGDKDEKVEAPSSEVTFLRDKKTRQLNGVAQKTGTIIIPKGKGVEDVVEAIGYVVDSKGVGKLVVNGYELKGKQQEAGSGADKGDTATEAKKTYFNKGRGYNHKENGATVSSYVKLITNPDTNEKFTSVEEAIAFYKNKYEEELKKSGGRGSKDKKTKGKTGKTIVVPE